MEERRETFDGDGAMGPDDTSTHAPGSARATIATSRGDVLVANCGAAVTSFGRIPLVDIYLREQDHRPRGCMTRILEPTSVRRLADGAIAITTRHGVTLLDVDGSEIRERSYTSRSGCKQARAELLPEGTLVGYDLDAKDRRVAKRIDGARERGWLHVNPPWIACLPAALTPMLAGIFLVGLVIPSLFADGIKSGHGEWMWDATVVLCFVFPGPWHIYRAVRAWGLALENTVFLTAGIWALNVIGFALFTSQ